MDPKYHKDHIDKINMGDRAKNFLESEDWKVLVKPIIDSMIKGLVDIRDVRKSLLISNKKAEIEVLGRALASEYLEKIEEWLNAYVDEGEASKALLEKIAKPNELYKET